MGVRRRVEVLVNRGWRPTVLLSAAAAAICLAGTPVSADELRERARRLIIDGYVVDGSLPPTTWQEKASCKADDDLDCWPHEVIDDFAVIRDEMGVDLLSRVGTTTTDPSKSRMKVLTSNDIDEAREKRLVGAIRYIQKPDAVEFAGVTFPLENLTRLAETRVRDWFDHDIRIVQIAYNSKENETLADRPIDSRYGGGSDQDKGVRATGAGECGADGMPRCVPLTALGQRLVSALLDRYMIIDLSHVGKATALRVVELAKARKRPVMANHTAARERRADRASRNHDDEVICAIASTGGVVGVTPVSYFLSATPLATTDKWVNRDLFIDHINHIRDLECRFDNGRPIAMINHISVASDSAINGFPVRNTDLSVNGFRQSDRWIYVVELMISRHGYSDAAIRRIFGENLLRVYRAALPGLLPPRIVNSTVDDEPVLPRQPMIAWTAAVAQGVRPAIVYTLHLVRRTPGGQRLPIADIGVTGRFDRLLPRLLPNTGYGVAVAATNGTESVQSAWFDFRTGN